MNNCASITNLELKSIFDLLGYNFVIPSYQRGFRWTKSEVEQLLNDIWDFTRKENKKQGEFYCLQPIVVKKTNRAYEVIDGQQRLTTIHLILSFIEKFHLKSTLQDVYFKEKFTIKYVTRPKSEEFLQNITEIEYQNKQNDNIDFYFINEAFKVIEKWFSNLNRNKKEQFLQVFLGELNEPTSHPVVVIWYEINDSSKNVVDIFTRLNIGKIPLTNAELVKALLLKSQNFPENVVNIKQIQIATEWYSIEKSLQNDNFWYFIYNGTDKKYDVRIEYILDLISKKNKTSDHYYTFLFFYSKLVNEKENIDDIWWYIKSHYLILEEWFNDFEFYHYIGYLITCEYSINEIIEEYKNKTKNEFRDCLKKKIKELINCTEEKLVELTYGTSKVKKILLLFNIQTIINSGNFALSFSFSHYKNANFEIEHVRSRSDKFITSEKKQREFLKDLALFLIDSDMVTDEDIEKENEESKKEILKKIKQMQNDEKINNIEFESLFNMARKYFHEEDDSFVDNISNLALLDAETNRSYGNSFFAIKRMKIIENDKKGKFIPIATKNLFLKYYSRKPKNYIYWTNEDAEDYLNAIKETLKEFLS
ncbi:MAG: DUF262 domain-containing protein [Bacteroidales bacterium]|nr:DUF262 domain-containing protein [Bacteroidales bacterium]